MKGKINILLSTFNGEKYLECQLASIFAQTYSNFAVNVRDDGSRDNTKRILEKYKRKYPNINVLYGINIGIANSFFELLANADPVCNYYAFCDQDDFWLPSKLSDAIIQLSQHDNSLPLLYCSGVEYVDLHLKHLGNSKEPSIVGLENALVENIATGCTIVINSVARRLIVQSLPRKTLIHDWWLYLVVSAFGEIIYDKTSNIKYRQHANNVIGSTPNIAKKILRRLLRLGNKRKDFFKASDQSIEFFRLYGSRLDKNKRVLVESFINSKVSVISRIKYLCGMRVRRQSILDNLILRVLIFLGWY